MKIYLSPANHTKPYITGHNEKQQMELVAKQVQKILGDYDCTVYYPTVFNDPNKDGNFGDGDYQGRPQEAQKLGCDVYVAIHSNAAAQMGAYATGCVVFYHPDDSSSKKLAEKLREKLDSVCPIKSNRYDKVINGMTYIQGGFGEIREPKKQGITPVLIETNFHSYEETAKWIVANISVIAKAIADVLIEFYLLKKKTGVTTPSQPTPDNSAIEAGDLVKVKSGAVYGGLIDSIRGKKVPDFVFTNRYQVVKMQTNKGVPEACLGGLNSWIAVDSLMKI